MVSRSLFGTFSSASLTPLDSPVEVGYWSGRLLGHLNMSPGQISVFCMGSVSDVIDTVDKPSAVTPASPLIYSYLW